MHANVAHIQPLAIIRRERLLPMRGRVIVRKGQAVQAKDVVAECDLVPKYMILDIARGLGVSPKRADSLLQVKMGMNIEERDILAGPVGWAKRVVRAPTGGKIILAGDGQILLQTKSEPYQLKAGFDGHVIELVAERGIILETRGVLVQGIWGNGRMETGLLVNAGSGNAQEFKQDHLSLDTSNAIVLAGWVSDHATLKSAAEIPIRGLILGGMDAGLIPLAREMPFPIMVVDAMAQVPMNDLAYQLLASNEKREISLNAAEWDLFTGVRPEVVIPLPMVDDAATSRDLEMVAEGQIVRICRAPHYGKIGTLERIVPGKAVLTNGLSVEAGEVRLENNELLISPLVNLEIIG